MENHNDQKKKIDLAKVKSAGLSDLDQTFCLATVTSSAYIQATLVMISSFLKHNQWFSGDIVIIHDDLSYEDLGLFTCFKNIKFLPVGNELKKKLKSLANAVPERQLKHKFVRFFSLEVFRLTRYSKTLFCDSDMLVLDNLRHLFEMSEITEADRLLCCGDKCFYHGQSRDVETFEPLLTDEERKSSKDIYISNFNSGFMVISNVYLDGKHYKNMLNLLVPGIWKKIRAPHTDQIVLNLYFRNRFKLISGRYNFTLIFGHKILQKENLRPDDIKIIHYAGMLKPWNLLEIIRKVVIAPDIIRYISQWHDQFFEFLPQFHLLYHHMNRTLKPRSEKELHDQNTL